MKKCPYCGEEIQDKAKKCRYCGEWFNNEDNIIKKIDENIISENNHSDIKKDDIDNGELKGLGGWLIFVGLGLIFTPFIILSTLNDVHINLINNGSFAQLINSDSSMYINGFLPLAIFEFFGNFLFIIFACILIYFYFIKHKNFPLLFKIYVISFFIFNILDYIIPDLMPKLNEVEDNGEYLVYLIRSFIYMLVWGSYMHVSKRVKNTFIENSYKKLEIIPIILLTIIFLSTILVLSSIDYSKLSYSEEDYGNGICNEKFGQYSYYTGEQENGQYLCDCKEGYEFGGENNNTCIISNK